MEDAKQWLIECGGLNGLGCGYWDRKSVVLDAGGLLGKLGSQGMLGQFQLPANTTEPFVGPPSAQLFIRLRWDVGSQQVADALDEEETAAAEVDVAEADIEAMEKRAAGIGKAKEVNQEKGYLSDDDIDEF